MAHDKTTTEAPKKKGFKMPDIYIILGIFILFMAVLTYIVPAGQYDRAVVETAHGTQNLVVAGTYKAVLSAPPRSSASPSWWATAWASSSVRA